jgi:hypothetical protein
MVLSSQQGKLSLLGAEHIQFEAFSHGVTSLIEVELLVGIPICSLGNDKNYLMSREIGFQEAHRNGTILDLRNETMLYGPDLISKKNVPSLRVKTGAFP